MFKILKHGNQRKAGCNRGGGSYTIEDNNISFAKIFTTKMFCGEKSRDTSFLRGLGAARTYRIEGNSLFIEGADGGGTMKFFKVVRQD